MAITINGTTGLAGVDGSAGTPAIQGADTNTGMFFPVADTIAFAEGGVEVARFDSSGNLGIGQTSNNYRLNATSASATNGVVCQLTNTGSTGAGIDFLQSGVDNFQLTMPAGAGGLRFIASGTNERMRIDSSGNLLVGKTTTSSGTAGFRVGADGFFEAVASAQNPGYINRLTNDGQLLAFAQDGTAEGSVSVAGTTVSYNGGHLSRWAQTTTTKDESLVKGTVLSNLDEMNVYTDAEGNPVDNEQLNKVKVSDVEGDVNVAGVFVNWTHDDAHDVDEINMAMTGDMIIRIAQGTTIQRGDLLMSAGDGTAKPQGDDIVRSKTVAKVTSTHVTCTYADGSFCVPCVLMAC